MGIREEQSARYLTLTARPVNRWTIHEHIGTQIDAPAGGRSKVLPERPGGHLAADQGVRHDR
jgi:hypothetical protein